MFSFGSQELCNASYPSHLMWYSSFPFLSLCPRILSTRNRGSSSADVPPRAPFCDGLAGFAAVFAPAGLSTAAGRAASALLAGRGSASEFAPAGFFGNPGAASGAFCRFAAGGTGGAPCASAVRAQVEPAALGTRWLVLGTPCAWDQQLSLRLPARGFEAR